MRRRNKRFEIYTNKTLKYCYMCETDSHTEYTMKGNFIDLKNVDEDHLNEKKKSK